MLPYVSRMFTTGVLAYVYGPLGLHTVLQLRESKTHSRHVSRLLIVCRGKITSGYRCMSLCILVVVFSYNNSFHILSKLCGYTSYLTLLQLVSVFMRPSFNRIPVPSLLSTIQISLQYITTSVPCPMHT